MSTDPTVLGDPSSAALTSSSGAPTLLGAREPGRAPGERAPPSLHCSGGGRRRASPRRRYFLSSLGGLVALASIVVLVARRREAGKKLDASTRPVEAPSGISRPADQVRPVRRRGSTGDGVSERGIPSGNVTLRVVDELGAPVVGAKLTGRLAFTGAELDAPVELRFETKSGADGNAAAQVDHLPDGSHPAALMLSASYENEWHGRYRLHAELGVTLESERVNRLGTLTLQGPAPSLPGTRLAGGIVADALTGVPLAGARVNLSLKSAMGDASYTSTTTTGGQGEFEFRGPASPGSLELQAFASGHRPASCTLEPGGNASLLLEQAADSAPR